MATHSSPAPVPPPVPHHIAKCSQHHPRAHAALSPRDPGPVSYIHVPNTEPHLYRVDQDLRLQKRGRRFNCDRPDERGRIELDAIHVLDFEAKEKLPSPVPKPCGSKPDRGVHAVAPETHYHVELLKAVQKLAKLAWWDLAVAGKESNPVRSSHLVERPTGSPNSTVVVLVNDPEVVMFPR